MNLSKLIEMLEYRRPSFSKTEKEFVKKFIVDPNPTAVVDGFGNIIIDTCKNPTIIFSCHTDTVDSVPGFRKVCHDADINILHTNNKEILGADDGAGIYIMLEMIQENISGRYIFHRSEEIGALGAQWIIDNTPHMLQNINHAIAFDRMGDTDVINHMITGKTATDKFVSNLCESLSENHQSATGTFTDTAFYIDHIKNCTNVSVGYYNQHTRSEILDLEHFSWLVNKVKTIDWNSL